MEKEKRGSILLQMLFSSAVGLAAGGVLACAAALIIHALTLPEKAMLPAVLICILLSGAAAGIALRLLRPGAPLFARLLLGLLTRGMMMLFAMAATGARPELGRVQLLELFLCAAGAVLAGGLVRRRTP